MVKDGKCIESIETDGTYGKLIGNLWENTKGNMRIFLWRISEKLVRNSGDCAIHGE